MEARCKRIAVLPCTWTTHLAVQGATRTAGTSLHLKDNTLARRCSRFLYPSEHKGRRVAPSHRLHPPVPAAAVRHNSETEAVAVPEAATVSVRVPEAAASREAPSACAIFARPLLDTLSQSWLLGEASSKRVCYQVADPSAAHPGACQSVASRYRAQAAPAVGRSLTRSAHKSLWED